MNYGFVSHGVAGDNDVKKHDWSVTLILNQYRMEGFVARFAESA
jgi:hypothetical protein